MSDPTQTVTLRKAYMREYRRRWRDVIREIKRYFRERPFNPAVFRGWLTRLLDDLLPTNTAWQNPYITPAFRQGVKLVNRDLASERVAGYPTDIDAILNDPSIRLELQSAQTQAREGLAKIKRDTMLALGSALLSGLVNDPIEARKFIIDRVEKVGRTRSQTLATTSIVSGVASASLAYMGFLGFKLVSPIIERQFVTAGDSRVCVECQGLAERDNGRGAGVYGLWESRGIIPVHPRCRCRWKVLVFGKDLPFGLQRR